MVQFMSSGIIPVVKGHGCRWNLSQRLKGIPKSKKYQPWRSEQLQQDMFEPSNFKRILGDPCSRGV